MDYKLLLEKIMQIDKNVRFSVISDMYANIILTRHRDGQENFLTEEETREALQYAVEAWRIRHKHEEKLGKGKFAMVEYETIKRISIPIGKDRLLLITIDNTSNGFEIVEKVLNEIKFPKS
ncbi:MAG: hypothetical protein ACE1YX_02100 [Nitrosopumilaceae archaeon]